MALILAPPQSSAQAERYQVLGAIDYESMEMFGTRTACRAEGQQQWVRADAVSAKTATQFCKVSKNSSGPRFEFVAAARFFDLAPDESGFAPQTTAGLSAHEGLLEAQAGVQLAEGAAGAVDFKAGLGITTGAGIKDDSASFKLFGCGISVGRKLGVSFFDNEIGVDLAKARQEASEKFQVYQAQQAVVHDAEREIYKDILGQPAAASERASYEGEELAV